MTHVWEDRLRGWLNRRWRARSTAAQIDADTVRAVLDAERAAIAELQQEVIHRLAFLGRAERDDGWERAELLATTGGTDVH